jgi:hypothetical protein
MIRNLGVDIVEVRFYDGDSPPKCSNADCS